MEKKFARNYAALHVGDPEYDISQEEEKKYVYKQMVDYKVCIKRSIDISLAD